MMMGSWCKVARSNVARLFFPLQFVVEPLSSKKKIRRNNLQECRKNAYFRVVIPGLCYKRIACFLYFPLRLRALSGVFSSFFDGGYKFPSWPAKYRAPLMPGAAVASCFPRRRRRFVFFRGGFSTKWSWCWEGNCFSRHFWSCSTMMAMVLEWFGSWVEGCSRSGLAIF